MPSRNKDLLLDDIQAAVARICRYTAGMNREEFLSDEKTIDAVVRNLEVIGEAVRWLPTEFKAGQPQIPWSQIAGLRHRIVHDYFGLDLEIIWRVLETFVPEFSAQLAELRN